MICAVKKAHTPALSIITAMLLLAGCSDMAIEERGKKQRQASQNADALEGVRSDSEAQDVSRSDESASHDLIEGLALVQALGELNEGELDPELIPDETEAAQSLKDFRARILKEFDANGNGRIDPGAERQALKAYVRKVLRDRALAKFDTNGDGVLDAEERAAMKEAIREKLVQRRAEHRGIRGMEQRKKRHDEICKRLQEHAVKLGEKRGERPFLAAALKRCERMTEIQDEDQGDSEE